MSTACRLLEEVLLLIVTPFLHSGRIVDDMDQINASTAFDEKPRIDCSQLWLLNELPSEETIQNRRFQKASSLLLLLLVALGVSLQAARPGRWRCTCCRLATDNQAITCIEATEAGRQPAGGGVAGAGGLVHAPVQAGEALAVLPAGQHAETRPGR